MSQSIYKVGEKLLGVVQERFDVGGVDLLGLSTGFHQIDKYTGGIKSDEMWILAGRTGLGKTAAGLGVARHVASQDNVVLFYSQEMSASTLVVRVLAGMTGVPGGRIVRGKLTKDELEKVRDAASDLRKYKMVISDATMTSDEIMKDSIEFGRKHAQPALVVVDYLQRLRDSNAQGDVARIGQITQNLRTLARPDHLDCGLLVLAQLNRGVEQHESGRPDIIHLRGSGEIEQEANVVLLLHRPEMMEMKSKGTAPKAVEDAEIIIGKNRDGIMCPTPAQFIPAQTLWKQEAPEPVEPKPLQPGMSLSDRVKAKR